MQCAFPFEIQVITKLQKKNHFKNIFYLLHTFSIYTKLPDTPLTISYAT